MQKYLQRHSAGEEEIAEHDHQKTDLIRKEISRWETSREKGEENFFHVTLTSYLSSWYKLWKEDIVLSVPSKPLANESITKYADLSQFFFIIWNFYINLEKI